MYGASDKYLHGKEYDFVGFDDDIKCNAERTNYDDITITIDTSTTSFCYFPTPWEGLQCDLEPNIMKTKIKQYMLFIKEAFADMESQFSTLLDTTYTYSIAEFNVEFGYTRQHEKATKVAKTHYESTHNLSCANCFTTGYAGFTEDMFERVLTSFFQEVELDDHLDIHFINKITIFLHRNPLRLGGSTELATLYKTKCHPLVCVCKTPAAKLNTTFATCHEWYIKSLFAWDEKGHPHAHFNNNIISVLFMKHAIETTFTVVDDVLFGGSLRKRNPDIEYCTSVSQLKTIASTGEQPLEEWGSGIRFCFYFPFMQTPSMMASVVIHELSHGMELINKGFFIPYEDVHSREWATIMRYVFSVFPFHTLSPIASCSRMTVSYVCYNCNYEEVNRKRKGIQSLTCPQCKQDSLRILPAKVNSNTGELEPRKEIFTV